jgi:hypothetical protein
VYATHSPGRTGWVVTGRIDVWGLEAVSEVCRFDLATPQWGPMPPLVTVCYNHASCAVRGALVVLGGYTQEFCPWIEEEEDEEDVITSRVETLSGGAVDGVFTSLPPLSCGGIAGAVAIGVEESTSAAGQVLLLRGRDEQGLALSTVYLVDLATGACTLQPTLLYGGGGPSAARLPDGRVVWAGGHFTYTSAAEVWGPRGGGASYAAWTRTRLPAGPVSIGRHESCGCVMSDGRFAILRRWPKRW